MAENYNIESFFPSAEYVVENAYMYAWECDIFIQMKSGYHYEIEQKISRSDFKADFKKSAKHFQLANSKTELITIPGSKLDRFINNDDIIKFDYNIDEIKGREANRWRQESGFYYWLSSYVSFRRNLIPNRFFYITPKGLINKKEVPKYAGLLEYSEGEIKQVKSAPFLHKNKYNYDKILLDKYKFRNANLKIENHALKCHLNKFNNIYTNPDGYHEQTELNF